MTASTSTYDDRDRSGARRPTFRAFVTWLAVGVVLGGLLAALLTISRPRIYTAEAVVGITPSSAILGEGDERQNVEAFIQSELIFFNAPQLQARVSQLAAGDVTEFEATQVGNTSAVSVTAVAPSRELALRTAALAVQLYADGREERLRREIATAAQTVDAELSRIESNLDAGVAGASALQGEYGRLLAVRSGLFRAEASVESAVTVIQPPTDESAGWLARLLRSVLGGALLGALAAVTALMVHRRLSRRIRVEGDLEALGLPVVRPALPRHRTSLGPLSADDRLARPGRLLSAQLAPSVDVPPVIVLCGPHRRVGTTWTAIALASSLVERTSVLLLLLCDVAEPGTVPAWLIDSPQDGEVFYPTPEAALRAARPTAVVGLDVLFIGEAGMAQRLLDEGLLVAARAQGYAVVVDAPALSESSTAMELSALADAFAMVVGLGATRVDEVEIAMDLLRRRDIHLDGVLLDHPVRRGRDPVEHLRRHPGPAPADGSGEADARAGAAEPSGGSSGPTTEGPGAPHAARVDVPPGRTG